MRPLQFSLKFWEQFSPQKSAFTELGYRLSMWMVPYPRGPYLATTLETAFRWRHSRWHVLTWKPGLQAPSSNFLLYMFYRELFLGCVTRPPPMPRRLRNHFHRTERVQKQWTPVKRFLISAKGTFKVACMKSSWRNVTCHVARFLFPPEWSIGKIISIVHP